MEVVAYRVLLSVTIQAAERMSDLARKRIGPGMGVTGFDLGNLLENLTAIIHNLRTLKSYNESNFESGLISAPDYAPDFIKDMALAFMANWGGTKYPYGEISTCTPIQRFIYNKPELLDDFSGDSDNSEITTREFCSLLIAIASQISQSKSIKIHTSASEGSDDKKRQSQTIKILQWLIRAKRVLTVDELLLAISVEHGQFNQLNIPDKAIFKGCWGLVLTKKNTASFICKDLKEYLLREPIISTGLDLEPAMTCISFLLYDVFSQGACGSPSSFNDRCHLYPFLLYVVSNLPFHLKQCGKDLPMELILRFLDSPGSMSSYWQVLYSLSRESWHSHMQFPGGHLSLHVAATLGICTAVQHCLEGIEATSLEDNGWKLVFIVSFWGHKAVLKLLVEVGIDTSVADFNGTMVLHLAAAFGDVSTVYLLLENNASISARDNEGLTALHLAVISGHRPVVSLLLKQGAEVSASDNTGETALHKAAIGGYDSIVSLLLERGAEVSVPDNIGETALHKAVISGHMSVIFLLLDPKGVSIVDNTGQTALHKAAIGGYGSVVSLLLWSNAEISIVDNTRQTALHKAAIGGHDWVVSVLLDRGAKVSVPDDIGQTALHKAAIGGHDSVVSLLLDRGAKVSVPDNTGETALHKAAIVGHESIVLLLLVKGADLKVLTNAKKKPIQLAEEGDHASVVQLMKTGLHVIYELETNFYDGWVVHSKYRDRYVTSHVKSEVEVWVRDRVIGTGGFATVYLEKREGGSWETERPLPSIDAGSTYIETITNFRRNRVRAVKQLSRAKNKRYAEELNALAQLIDRPDLFVRFLGWYENKESIFIAMEYIEHGDLSAYIKADNYKARLGAKTIANQILHGLVFLHDKNICHRDLKPQNVVACLDPLIVKITDFGISKSSEEMSTHIGTYPYMAPEILGILPVRFQQRSRYTKMIDIWAFGCLIHEVLTSGTPFFLRPSFETARKSTYIETARESKGTYTTLLSAPKWEDPASKLSLRVLMEYCETEVFPDDFLRELHISEEGIAFVKSLLVVDPKSRISARDALDSGWLRNIHAPEGRPGDWESSRKCTRDATAAINSSKLCRDLHIAIVESFLED